MATIENKKFTLTVYNTVTRRNEEVEVTREVYHAYRRTGWNIEDNDASFFEHEIQMSGLIGGEDGAYENFREFIDTENIPDNTVLKETEIEALQRAVSALPDADKALIKALFYDGLTEREYAKETGIPQKTINNRKMVILRKLRKLSDFKK
ncbi:RNA polymerase sigma factor [Massiliimalia massiliensis]|uniref:RNA polymerase sigma factor n=1 Tax=Massiliimalia massiliensis TaxID=1852384 RepID=UPI0009858530|nr:sigma-70 family RNA polymerase sigma factor [Massiliimalia massiliensis]